LEERLRGLSMVMCPWSDHWGVAIMVRAGGDSLGPGRWRLNVGLLKIEALWVKYRKDLQKNIDRWKSRDTIRMWWPQFKEWTGAWWREAGSMMAKCQRERKQRLERQL